jgi:hypothetical protein
LVAVGAEIGEGQPLNPNRVNILDNFAWCKLMTRSLEEAIPLAAQAVRLSPHDTPTWQFLCPDWAGASVGGTH